MPKDSITIEIYIPLAVVPRLVANGILLGSRETESEQRIIRELIHKLIGLPRPRRRGETDLTPQERQERGRKARAKRGTATKMS